MPCISQYSFELLCFKVIVCFFCFFFDKTNFLLVFFLNSSNMILTYAYNMKIIMKWYPEQFGKTQQKKLCVWNFEEWKIYQQNNKNINTTMPLFHWQFDIMLLFVEPTLCKNTSPPPKTPKMKSFYIKKWIATWTVVQYSTSDLKCFRKSVVQS